MAGTIAQLHPQHHISQAWWSMPTLPTLEAGGWHLPGDPGYIGKLGLRTAARHNTHFSPPPVAGKKGRIMSLRPAGHLQETCLKVGVLLVSSCGHRMLREGSYSTMLKTQATEESLPQVFAVGWGQQRGVPASSSAAHAAASVPAQCGPCSLADEWSRDRCVYAWHLPRPGEEKLPWGWAARCQINVSWQRPLLGGLRA